MDKPIESVSLAAENNLCVATTRNQTAVFDLENGRLVKLFVSNMRASVVSLAIISKDGSLVLTAESQVRNPLFPALLYPGRQLIGQTIRQ